VKIHIRFLLFKFSLLIVFFLISCQKKEVLQAEEPKPIDTIKPIICPDCDFPDTVWQSASASKQLIFRVKFDSLQLRLNDQGQVSTPSSGIGAQSPSICGISINYIELMPDAATPPGAGVLLYKTSETNCGGNKATNFCKGVVVKENEVLYAVDLSLVPPGSYQWLRISIAYQEMKIQSRTVSTGNTPATFIGFAGDQSYLSKLKIENSVVTPTLGGSGNKSRGYWMFYQELFHTTVQLDGQCQKTTVVNSNPQATNTNSLSFIYGEFMNSNNSSIEALSISGTEVTDREITLHISSNKSFEWKELTNDGIFQPDIGEVVLDFGFRGLIPKF